MPKEHLPEEEQQTKESRARAQRAAGRGFFIALALCIIAVGGVAASTFSETLKAPSENSDNGIATTTLRPTVTTVVAPAGVTAVKTTTMTTTTPSLTTTSASSALFVLPLSNEVLTPFSEQPIYSETMKDYRAHIGVDFDGEEGQAVRALADGTITAVEKDTLWGGCITVDHGGGIVSVYRGVEATVPAQTAVKVGDSIGVVSSVPCESTMGPHLHLELYQNGEAIDVTTLLSGQLITDPDIQAE